MSNLCKVVLQSIFLHVGQTSTQPGDRHVTSHVLVQDLLDCHLATGTQCLCGGSCGSTHCQPPHTAPGPVCRSSACLPCCTSSALCGGGSGRPVRRGRVGGRLLELDQSTPCLGSGPLRASAFRVSLATSSMGAGQWRAMASARWALASLSARKQKEPLLRLFCFFLLTAHPVQTAGWVF
jgi:hypothetical protein